MPGVASNAVFSYRGVSGLVTGIQVETPVAVTVDMTGVGSAPGNSVIVPTGEKQGGSISVDFIEFPADPQSLVGTYGIVSFTSSAYTISRQVVLESAAVSARVGELVSGSLKFRITDYYG